MNLFARSNDLESTAGRRAARFHIDDPALQGKLRNDLRGLLETGDVPASTIDDVLIVVSELLSNAQEHAGADEVSVELATHDHEVWAMVAYQAPISVSPDELSHAVMPSADAVRGRGLAIVDALTTSNEHRRSGSTFCTECTFHYG